MPTNNDQQQRCFYPRCLWMSTDASLGAGLHSHSHALSLSVSPCVCPHYVLYKNPSSAKSIIIEIQDSFVFGCSHFISVALTRNQRQWNNVFNIDTINKSSAVTIRLQLLGITKWHLSCGTGFLLLTFCPTDKLLIWHNALCCLL